MAQKSFFKIDVVKTVNNVFDDAISQGASDIHIEPLLNEVLVRYRMDGILRVIVKFDIELYDQIVSRIKIMSGMETTGLARPQEGNLKYENSEKSVDLRVSIFPTSSGENIVIRILESAQNFNDFSDIGFTPEQIKIVETIIKRPFGLILVTGPNGSGKSTTLFNILNKLNDTEKSLVTLEDPVERKVEMVRQTQIDHNIGLTFAEGLRFLLRQDPDVIMVGEIRDNETARIAVEAAVTGHLVLATIHTNNAAGAAVRLINMGVEPFLLATALKFVSAQRLARKNCPHCRKNYTPAPELFKLTGLPKNMNFFQSAGCQACNHRGVKGRLGIHEVLVINKAIHDLILSRPSDEQISALAQEQGMMNLRRVALSRVNEGLITIEEALRLTE